VRSLYRSASLTTVTRELGRYWLDLRESRRSGGTKEALNEQGIVLLYMEREMKIINYGQDYFVHSEQ
jgi:hypothetical protein